MPRRLVILLALAIAASLLIWWNAVIGVLFAVAILIPVTLSSILNYVQRRRADWQEGYDISNRPDL